MVPPTRKKACQPWEWTSVFATRPIEDEPKLTPEYITMMRVERKRLGAYSAVMAMALGMSPPMPMPARKRNVTNCSIEPAAMPARVKIPTTAEEPIVARRRP